MPRFYFNPSLRTLAMGIQGILLTHTVMQVSYLRLPYGIPRY